MLGESQFLENRGGITIQKKYGFGTRLFLRIVGFVSPIPFANTFIVKPLLKASSYEVEIDEASDNDVVQYLHTDGKKSLNDLKQEYKSKPESQKE